MNRPLNDTQIQEYLTLFVDGQLDDEKTLLILEYLAVNPPALQQVIRVHQLRQAVNRVMRRGVPDAPETLKLTIQQLAQHPPHQEDDAAVSPHGQQDVATGRPILTQIGRWTPLAAAAIFFIAAMVVLTIGGQNHEPVSLEQVSQARYAMFVYRHTGCSEEIAELRNRHLFVQDLQQLPGTLAEYLGGSLATGLDLSKVGYEFYAVGECSVPGARSVHLIYRAKADPSGQDTLSLWIRRHDRSPNIEPNRPYFVMGQSMANPLLLWRQGDMIYYLVGNSLGSLENAAHVLQTTSSPPGSKQTELERAISAVPQALSYESGPVLLACALLQR